MRSDDTQSTWEEAVKRGGKRIGIVGGGQLARMLGFAAKRLGFTVTVIDPTPESPAGQVVDKQIVAAFTDEKAIAALAKEVDYLTFDIESIGIETLLKLVAQGIPVNPHPHTLAIIKDKLKQKQFLAHARIPVAEFIEVKNPEDLARAAKQFGYPILLKTRLGGYDGRGNATVRSVADGKKEWKRFAGQPLYAEKFVPFTKELAVMVARDMDGNVVSYPAVETIHKNHICHVVKAPAPVSSTIQKKAQAVAKKVVAQLEGAGVFGIELFLTKKGDVIVNEIAPRVHNSGHYTIEACVTDQFEQHIRAVTGMPLGSTAMKVPAAVMVNILGERTGERYEGVAKALAVPQASVHLYGKKESRPERKMGHITAVDKTILRAYASAMKARKAIII